MTDSLLTHSKLPTAAGDRPNEGEDMRNTVLVLAGVCATLVLAASAPAALIVGVNDDAPKIDTFASWFFSTMQSQGLKLNTLTLTWDDADPNTIPAEDVVTAAVAAAAVNGISVEFDLYPLHSQALSDGVKCTPSSNPTACGNTDKIQAFAAWAASVARDFPTVHQFVVMNECNQPLFNNPQWDASGKNQSAAICGRALAAAYDAIKGVDKSSFVWGVGLSPRGNDNAQAASNSSTSPVKFIGYLGAWFKAFAQKTHRTAPLMDGFDFHPYPVPQTLPFEKGYANRNNAALSNLPRIYQAFYDAFNGSPQKTIGQQPGGGLPVSLNEVGIQTQPNGSEYFGSEVSATSAGGVLGEFATPEYQAQWYSKMLNLVACDPNIRVLNIFHLVDESLLAGWQSGIYYADHTPKESAQTVSDWFSSTGGRCKGTKTPWTPSAAAATTTATKTKGEGKTNHKGKTNDNSKTNHKSKSSHKSKSNHTSKTSDKSNSNDKGTTKK